uniref:Uncharacterized protein n=1 Tax=Anopheles coluzzii TaxID=1518534 RepID=A0A6E8VRY6_ANOCL
ILILCSACVMQRDLQRLNPYAEFGSIISVHSALYIRNIPNPHTYSNTGISPPPLPLPKTTHQTGCIKTETHINILR